MGMSPRLLRPRASGGFSPKNISGLALWLDSADSTSITLNGGNVSEWRDKSGLGRNVSQATAANQPAYTTAGQNGRNCVTWSASAHRLTADAAADWSFLHDGLSHYAIYIVAGSNSVSGSGNVNTFISTRGSYNSYGTRGFDLTQDFGGLAANNRLRASISNGSSAVGLVDLSATGDGVTRLYEIIGDPANATSTQRLKLKTGAGVSGTSSPADGVASTDPPAAALTLGSPAQGALFPLLGKICEVVFYSRSSVITATESSALFSYFSKKWAV